MRQVGHQGQIVGRLECELQLAALHPVGGARQPEGRVAIYRRVVDQRLHVLPVHLIDRGVDQQAMLEEFRLEADFVVEQRVGRVAQGLVELPRLSVGGASYNAIGQRHAVRVDPDLRPPAGDTVERAGTIALRVGVVEHRVRRDVPGDVSAALEGVGDRRREALAIRYVHAGSWVAVLRTDLLLDVLEVACAAGDREHLRDDVEVGRREHRGLLVAALQILAEVGVVVAGRRIDRRLHRGHIRQADGPARERSRKVFGRAGRDCLLQEVHVVLDLKIFPVSPEEAAQPPVVRRRRPDLVALVRALEIVVPAHDRRVAGGGARVAQVRTAAARARVIEPSRGAGVVRVIHVGIDVAGQVRAGVDSLDIADLAVDRPGCALGLILVPGRHEGGFLQRLQRR